MLRTPHVAATTSSSPSRGTRRTRAASRPRATPSRGLRNVGNTCYANAVIQALFASPVIRACVLASTPASTAADVALQNDRQQHQQQRSTLRILSRSDLRLLHAILSDYASAAGVIDCDTLLPRSSAVPRGTALAAVAALGLDASVFSGAVDRLARTEHIPWILASFAIQYAALHHPLHHNHHIHHQLDHSTTTTKQQTTTTTVGHKSTERHSQATVATTGSSTHYTSTTAIATATATAASSTLLDELGLLFLQLCGLADEVTVESEQNEIGSTEDAAVAESNCHNNYVDRTPDSTKRHSGLQQHDTNQSKPVVVMVNGEEEKDRISNNSRRHSVKSNSKLDCVELHDGRSPSVPVGTGTSSISDSSLSITPTRFLDQLWLENESFSNTAMHHDAHEMMNFTINSISSTLLERRNSLLLEFRDWLSACIAQTNASHSKSLSSNSRKTINKTGNEVDGVANIEGHDVKQEAGFTGVESLSLLGNSDVLSTALADDRTWIQHLFQGTLSNETRCLTCDSITSRDDLFLDLSIDIEPDTTLESCLEKFESAEYLQQRNKFFCSRCNALQEAEKRLRIKRLPNLLVLHLKRFKFVTALQESTPTQSQTTTSSTTINKNVTVGGITNHDSPSPHKMESRALSHSDAGVVTLGDTTIMKGNNSNVNGVVNGHVAVRQSQLMDNPPPMALIPERGASMPVPLNEQQIPPLANGYQERTQHQQHDGLPPSISKREQDEGERDGEDGDDIEGKKRSSPLLSTKTIVERVTHDVNGNNGGGLQVPSSNIKLQQRTSQQGKGTGMLSQPAMTTTTTTTTTTSHPPSTTTGEHDQSAYGQRQTQGQASLYQRHHRKLSYKVEFPILLNPLDGGQQYELVAVVVHIGNSSLQGHYVTVARLSSQKEFLDKMQSISSKESAAEEEKEMDKEEERDINGDNNSDDDDGIWYLIDDFTISSMDPSNLKLYFGASTDETNATKVDNVGGDQVVEANHTQQADTSGSHNGEHQKHSQQQQGTQDNVGKTFENNKTNVITPSGVTSTEKQTATGYILLYKAVGFDPKPLLEDIARPMV